MGMTRAVRCDLCEEWEVLSDEDDPVELGWLLATYGVGDEDAGYFCSLTCLSQWAASDQTKDLIESLVSSEDDEDEE